MIKLTLICKLCGEFHKTPDKFTRYGVEIGPYCLDCWHKIKLCDRCGTVDIFQKDARRKGVSKYTDVGECLCTACRASTRGPNPRKCPSCNQHRSVFTKVSGQEICTCCAINKGLFFCEICKDWHTSTENFWESDVNILKYNKLYLKYAGGVCKSCSTEVIKGVPPLEIQKCVHCTAPATDYYLSSNSDKPGKRYVCRFCADRLYKCDDCGKVHTDSAFKATCSNGVRKQLCVTCYRNYKYCEVCRLYHLTADCTSVSGTINTSRLRMGHGSYVCSSCLPTLVACDRCERLLKPGDIVAKGGNRYCSVCAERVAVCSTCNKTSEYIVGDTGRCRRCYVDRFGIGQLEAYNFKPKFYKHQLGNDPLLFGLENEIDIQDRSVDAAVGFIHKHWPEDSVYCVHDGSIRDGGANGFEVVTHPRSFESIKTLDWTKLFPPGTNIHKACGMHVHLSREAFTRFHLFKFVDFIHNKPNFIRMVGQRMSTRYCLKNEDSSMASMVKYKQTATRYSKINLNNSATVELRFFANVATEEGLLKNVEFLKALFEYTLLTSNKNCTVMGFLKHVVRYRKKFNNLAKFLESYKLLKLPRRNKINTKKEVTPSV